MKCMATLSPPQRSHVIGASLRHYQPHLRRQVLGRLPLIVPSCTLFRLLDIVILFGLVKRGPYRDDPHEYRQSHQYDDRIHVVSSTARPRRKIHSPTARARDWVGSRVGMRLEVCFAAMPPIVLVAYPLAGDADRHDT